MKVPEKHRALAHLAVDGADIEYECEGEWFLMDNLYFLQDMKYRVKVEPTPDYIDWSHVHEKFVALVTHKYAGAKLVTEVPTKQTTGYWRLNSHNGISIDAESFASYKKGNTDWKDSLVLRPMEAAKTLTKEQWAKIPAEYIYAAADCDGEWYAFITKPKKYTRHWYGNNVCCFLRPDDVGTLPDVPWEDSLCKRPE